MAPHHAGHLTAWRLVVDEFLDRGLIRAVAATARLASGLDVPVRTVVLTPLSCQSPEGHVDLSAKSSTRRLARRAVMVKQNRESRCVEWLISGTRRNFCQRQW